MWKFYDQQNGCRWRQGRKIHHMHKVKRSGESPPCNQSCCSDCSLHSLKMMHVTLLMQYCHFKVVLVVCPILTGMADFPSTWSTVSNRTAPRIGFQKLDGMSKSKTAALPFYNSFCPVCVLHTVLSTFYFERWNNKL